MKKAKGSSGIARGCILLEMLLCINAFAASGNIEKPNLIIILSDDQGYGDLGCYGAKDFTTPHIDQMAKEGVRFTGFYAAPACSPTRASLLTGCYAQRVGILAPQNGPNIGLHPDEITLAESLKTLGYATALIGKWHLGLVNSMLPTNQGFDYFSGIPLSHIRKGKTEHTDGPKAYYKRQWKTAGIGIETEVEYAPDETLFTKRCTDEALRFIKENHKKPFFLFLSHPQVHKEVLSSAAFAGRTKRGRYGDSCEEIDWSTGEVLKILKTLGIDENTLVIYASDNGPWLKQGDQSGSAGPLKGGKFSSWEGGVRVPCIMRWPGKIPAGIECHELATVMDIFPTFAKLVGTAMPADRTIDGKDIWPLISGVPGSKTPHEKYIYHNSGKLEAVRYGDWKYRLDQLYNLQDDIEESRDLSKEHPEIVERCAAFLEEALADMGDRRRKIKGKDVRPQGKFDK